MNINQKTLLLLILKWKLLDICGLVHPDDKAKY